MLRMGDPKAAKRSLRDHVLDATGRRLRQGAAPELIFNFALATLRTQGVPACDVILNQLGDWPGAAPLRQAIRVWRGAMADVHQVRQLLSNPGGMDLRLPDPVGILLDLDTRSAGLLMIDEPPRPSDGPSPSRTWA
jgi:hypothetical protein